MNETVERELEVVAPDMLPFTNYLDEDITLKWDSKAYTFKARTTTSLLGKIPDATIEQTKSIRWKFACDLAEHAFFTSKDYTERDNQPIGSGFMGRPYVDADFDSYRLRCLEPLPISMPIIMDVKENMEQKMEQVARGRGRPKSRVLKGNEDLIKEAQSKELE